MNVPLLFVAIAVGVALLAGPLVMLGCGRHKSRDLKPPKRRDPHDMGGGTWEVPS